MSAERGNEVNLTPDSDLGLCHSRLTDVLIHPGNRCPDICQVTDNLTGLVWSKDANPAGTAKTWQQALDYVKTLNSQKYLGYTDWRLQGDADGTIIGFSNGTASAMLTGGVMSVGGATVGSAVAGLIAPVLK